MKGICLTQCAISNLRRSQVISLRLFSHYQVIVIKRVVNGARTVLTLVYITVLASTTHPLPANHIHFGSYLRYLALVWADITEAGAHRSFPSFPRRTVPQTFSATFRVYGQDTDPQLTAHGRFDGRGGKYQTLSCLRSPLKLVGTLLDLLLLMSVNVGIFTISRHGAEPSSTLIHTNIFSCLISVVFFAILTAFQLAIFYPPFSLSPVHLGIALPCANIGLGSSPSTVVGNFPRYCHPSYRRSTPNNFDLRADLTEKLRQG